MMQEKPPGSLADMARAQQARIAQADKDKKAAIVARLMDEGRNKDKWEGIIVDFSNISQDINVELEGTDVSVSVDIGAGINSDSFEQINLTLQRKYVAGDYPYIYFTCTKSGNVSHRSSSKAFTTKVMDNLPLSELETSFFEGKVREFVAAQLK